MRIEIVGGPHCGEQFEVPEGFKVPKPTESLTENTVNQAYTAVELEKLKKVMDILNETPGVIVTMQEIKPKPPKQSWEK